MVALAWSYSGEKTGRNRSGDRGQQEVATQGVGVRGQTELAAQSLGVRGQQELAAQSLGVVLIFSEVEGGGSGGWPWSGRRWWRRPRMWIRATS